MIHIDKDALECDLAETYHIYDMYGLPLQKVALFACGLREDSRIKMKLSNQKVPFSDYVLASIYDRVSFLAWSQTEDAQRGRNRPQSLLKALMGDEKKDSGIITYDSVYEFERELARIKKEAERNE